MGSYIAKQPNGLYCRFSDILDCPTHKNLTQEDIHKLFKEEALTRAAYEAEYVLNHAHSFDEVKEDFIPNNMTQKDFDAWLNDVSDERGKV